MNAPATDTPVAIITGAGRGIGAATAVLLAEAGWTVALADICEPDPDVPYPLATRDELAAVAARCGPTAVAAEVDVRNQDALTDFIDQVVADTGRLDAAISAAGAIVGGPTLWECNDTTWQTMLDINLTGVFHLVRASMPHLLADDGGRFVAIASAAGSVGLPRLGAYTAAKHGVIGLIRALAAECGAEGVNANVVSPGSTRTTMLDATANIYELGADHSFAEHSRLARLLEPDEVAAAAVWLCSDAASGVNGSVLAVDGGFSG